jgi:hypothetical protein
LHGYRRKSLGKERSIGVLKSLPRSARTPRRECPSHSYGVPEALPRRSVWPKKNSHGVITITLMQWFGHLMGGLRSHSYEVTLLHTVRRCRVFCIIMIESGSILSITLLYSSSDTASSSSEYSTAWLERYCFNFGEYSPAVTG